MNSVVEDTLNKLKQCDDFHNRCDCLLEHSEITYLLEYIQQKENIINELEEFKEEHKIMKQILIENNLWETLLNDDRFLEHLRK